MAGARGRGKGRESNSAKKKGDPARRRNKKTDIEPEVEPDPEPEVEVEREPELNDHSDDEESIVPPKRSKTNKPRQVAEVVVSTRAKRQQVTRAARRYIDEEAEEDDGLDDSEEENDEDREFIDDRDEEELENEADNTEEEEQDQASIAEIEEPVTPPPVRKNKRVIRSPSVPLSETVARSPRKAVAKRQATPETPKLAGKTRTIPKVETPESDNEVVEIPKPASLANQKKGKGKVIVEHVNHKLVVAGSGRGKKNIPIPDAEHNVFYEGEDDMDVDEDTGGNQSEEAQPSPRKKAKLDKEDDVQVKKKPRVRVKVPDAVTETPTKGITRYMAASTLNVHEGENEEDEEDGHPDQAVVGTLASGSGKVEGLPSTSTKKGKGKESRVPNHFVEAVSNPENPDHVNLMGRDMIETYGGRLAPPIIREAHIIVTCGESSGAPWTTFKAAMDAIGVKRTDSRFNVLRSVSIQPAFGPFLYNLSRIDPYKIIYTATSRGPYTNTRYAYGENLSGSGQYKIDDAIAFTMFGTVVESHVINSIPRVNGKHQRLLRLKPLTMEFYRAVNVLASVWGLDADTVLEVNKDGGGFTFTTLPSDSPHGPRWASPPSSPRKATSRESSEEPEIDFPETSIGGRAVMSAGIKQSREEIKQLATGGKIFNQKVPVYNFIGALTQNPIPPLNQELLTGADVWRGGEIKHGSYVCVHYCPSFFVHRGNKEVQWNLLRVVVLAVPPQ